MPCSSGGAWSEGVPGLVGLGPGGCLMGVPGPGGCMVETPTRTATAAGGTHPTGMYSCFILFLVGISASHNMT